MRYIVQTFIKVQGKRNNLCFSETVTLWQSPTMVATLFVFYFKICIDRLKSVEQEKNHDHIQLNTQVI